MSDIEIIKRLKHVWYRYHAISGYPDLLIEDLEAGHFEFSDPLRRALIKDVKQLDMVDSQPDDNKLDV